MKLTRQEMMQYKDLLENLEPGDQTYTFHCKQGDQNDRLNIKFDSSGEYYLFHCLHCGAGGRLNSRAHSATARLQRPKRYPEGHVSKFVRLPEDLRIAGETWDVRATHWVKQYGITDEELLWNGIGYSPSRGRVILPVYRETELQGYLERKIFDEDPG
ncbi:hypothetical protein GWN63_00005, partial [Candidatus Bathyarchaeota archaeon]|nr:hypothetical protein [Candidatus Bathyarchaeota archaeon]NIR16043.1 hypothetical protein [Desulfobacterales bacterium]NIU80625.1 hypothetical protein [Candidatus Bathyarchaeota archaeon]NIV67467.1 hypothetical protein [Candidatus Bathyarchaeota archaeon]